jgi:hypothetical protein
MKTKLLAAALLIVAVPMPAQAGWDGKDDWWWCSGPTPGRSMFAFFSLPCVTVARLSGR